MPDPERMLDQHDPTSQPSAALHRALTATLTSIMERASVAELFGLQGSLSHLASRLTDGGNGGGTARGERPRLSMLQGLGPNILHDKVQYRQEGP